MKIKMLSTQKACIDDTGYNTVVFKRGTILDSDANKDIPEKLAKIYVESRMAELVKEEDKKPVIKSI